MYINLQIQSKVSLVVEIKITRYFDRSLESEKYNTYCVHSVRKIIVISLHAQESWKLVQKDLARLKPTVALHQVQVTFGDLAPPISK